MNARYRDLLKFLNQPVVALGVFLLLIVTYILIGIRMANSIWFTMDEGSYLIKGYWFLIGQERPFEINGPITNKPPLAFLIPGLSQLIQPGIASGRILNVLILAGALVGLWLIIRRDHNPWWGNLAILLVIINPAWMEYYTRVMTQTPTIFFLVWSLYFSLGKSRSLTQLAIGTSVGVLVLFTRQNMAFYLPLLWGYLAWEHGLKRSIQAFLPALGVFVLLNSLFWPGIFIMLWAKVLPSELTDQLLTLIGLSQLINPPNSGNFKIEHSTIQLIQELFGGARISLLAMLTAICSLLLIPIFLRSKRSEAKQFVFITVIFWANLLIHVLVLLDMNVLLYSFPAYLLFWAPAVFILFPRIAESVSSLSHGWRKWVLAALFVILSTGIGLHLYRTVSLPLMNLAFPRLGEGKILPGNTELWRVIVNKFGVEYRQQEYLWAAMAGALAGIGLLILIKAAVWMYSRLTRRSGIKEIKYLASLFFVIAILTPTWLLSGKQVDPTCSDNTLEAIARVGEEINRQVEPGSLIFWGAHAHPTVGILLYIDQARVFPEQLNGQFYYRSDLTLEQSQESIFWSDAQAREWLREADYLIVDPAHLSQWDELLNTMPEIRVDQLSPTTPLEPCDPGSSLFILKLNDINDH